MQSHGESDSPAVRRPGAADADQDLSVAMRQGEWRLAQFEERMCG